MIRRLARLLTAFFACALLVVGCQIVRNSGDQPLLPQPPGALRVATWNVHYIDLRADGGPWSVADWMRRRGPMAEAVRAIDADVFAFQEMESFGGGEGGTENLTLEWLRAEVPNLAAAAVGDPAAFPSTQPIFYRTDRLEVLDQGWFFFSDTPEVIYSRTFNGSYPAFASWARFRDRGTGATFRVVNVHTDYASPSNRLASVALVAERAADWIAADERVILAGDLNARRGDRTLAILEAAGLTFVPVEGATYHFNRGLNLFAAIDHIGHSDRISAAALPVVLRRRVSGEWPSDHYPVIADLVLD